MGDVRSDVLGKWRSGLGNGESARSLKGGKSNAGMGGEGLKQ
jgi:hypothetical protein